MFFFCLFYITVVLLFSSYHREIVFVPRDEHRGRPLHIYTPGNALFLSVQRNQKVRLRATDSKCRTCVGVCWSGGGGMGGGEGGVLCLFFVQIQAFFRVVGIIS